jgi:prolyl oligopeptidase
MPAPTARVEPVQDTYFGVTITDPYRWMEAQSPEYEQWLLAQAAYADEQLAELPGRDALLARIRELRGSRTERFGYAWAGGWEFSQLSDPARRVPVLTCRPTGGGAERVLVDPNEIPGEAHHHLGFYHPSPSGRYVLAGVSAGGSERCTLRIVETATGQTVEEAIGNVRFPYLSWLDDETFGYHAYRTPPPGADPAARRLDTRCLLHRLGTDPGNDRVLLARGVHPDVPMAPTDRPFPAYLRESGRLMMIVSHRAIGGRSVSSGFTANTIYLAPASRLDEPAAIPWVRVAGPDDHVVAYAADADTLYLVTGRGGGYREVVAVPLADPAIGNATVLVPEGDRVIEAIDLAGDRLLVRELEVGEARLRSVPVTGGTPREVPLPAHSALLEVAAPPGGSTVRLRLESWFTPPTWHAYDLAAGVTAPAGEAAAPPELTVHREWATARDGTRVPITLLCRADVDQDGQNPTLLSAYGAYGLIQKPHYRPGRIGWLERGGVYAVAHVRGGGEFGDRWRAAGALLTKENTITDLIDCAEHLITAGWTAPGRIAAEGTSGGGIPSGGALVRRPDLWGAVVMQVPHVNGLHAEFSENGPVNVPEFGTVGTEQGFAALRIIDAYQRVVDGTAYPAVLLTAGMNDTRVVTWQPAKLAARLRAASSSGKPVLLRVERHGGHGIAGTSDQADALLADLFAFLAKHLGLALP